MADTKKPAEIAALKQVRPGKPPKGLTLPELFEWQRQDLERQRREMHENIDALFDAITAENQLIADGGHFH